MKLKISILLVFLSLFSFIVSSQNTSLSSDSSFDSDSSEYSESFDVLPFDGALILIVIIVIAVMLVIVIIGVIVAVGIGVCLIFYFSRYPRGRYQPIGDNFYDDQYELSFQN